MNSPFRTGFEGLLDASRLRGRRVGLLAHPASLCVDGTWTPQALWDSGAGELAALFGPEHGLYGQGGAGDTVSSSLHPRWNVPVYSLYGEARQPTPRMLEGLDLLVVDLQDLAVRCYTFVSTLRLVLRAAHQAGLPVAVADRPVPFPSMLDGPMPEPGFESFVCALAAPFVYGMTPAEAARWLVGKERLRVELHAEPMSGYRREPRRPAGAPPWVPPSTGIRSWESAWCYPATVFTEALPALDCDRRGLLPFQVLGAPWMRGEELARAMNEAQSPGLSVTPHDYVDARGTMLQGIRFVVTDPARFAPVTAGFLALQTIQRLYGRAALWEAEGTRPEFFDALCGSARPREALQDGVPVGTLADLWRRDRAQFEEERRACLLYGEGETRERS